MTQHDENKQSSLYGQGVQSGKLPVAKAEDVEFSEELADEADRIAAERARQADARVEQ
ncbi:YfhD family protein [Paenibacillus sp. SC116]|uniref:YfhD family protein n=1 Tax=Paenibacillus sp. SC116 TaxID=2968986 RepID=UPI00215A17D4|nr:YfhD family protein [Paenibacillus sp. SC116]MCR8845816.1 YfhD family protein [Paenibacillus sp. SC116]